MPWEHFEGGPGNEWKEIAFFELETLLRLLIEKYGLQEKAERGELVFGVGADGSRLTANLGLVSACLKIVDDDALNPLREGEKLFKDGDGYQSRELVFNARMYVGLETKEAVREGFKIFF